MVRTKSAVASHRVAGDTDSNSSTACNIGRSECRSESFRFRSTSYSDTTDADAAAGISKSRTEGGAGDY